MSNHTYKIIEVVGSSKLSSDEAVKSAVAKASESIKNMRWVEVQQVRGHIVDNQVDHWQAVLKIGFTLED
jgi:dodecin